MYQLWTDHLIDTFAAFADALSCAARLGLGVYEYRIEVTQ